MDDVALEDGDEITVRHLHSGETRTVEYAGVHNDDPYVRWPMCGEYCVKLSDGMLRQTAKSRRTTPWQVDEEWLSVLRAAVREERNRIRERLKKNK